MNGYIKREDAYQTLTDYYHQRSETQHEALREALNRVPAADVVEVLRGEWVKHDDDAIECSVCGLGLPSFVMGVFFRFCPNCGCSMEVDNG